MHYYESMQALIGHTPLVRLSHVGVPEGVKSCSVNPIVVSTIWLFSLRQLEKIRKEGI